jgi:hypothetical protein
MWFFMISSYLLSALTFLMLLIMMLQSFVVIPSFQIPALTFLVLTSIVYCFTETLIIFFFVGTGVSVRDYSKDNNLSDEYRKKSLAIKFRVYPPTMLNLLLMITLFILPGAVHAGKISTVLYQCFFGVCVAHYVYTKIIQHECFRDNTNNILAMSGIAPHAPTVDGNLV